MAFNLAELYERVPPLPHWPNDLMRKLTIFHSAKLAAVSFEYSPKPPVYFFIQAVKSFACGGSFPQGGVMCGDSWLLDELSTG